MTKTDHISYQGSVLWTILIAEYKKIRISKHFQKPHQNDKFELSAIIVKPTVLFYVVIRVITRLH